MGKPGDWEVLSIVPRLFLDWCSIGALLFVLLCLHSPDALRSRPPRRHGMATDPVPGFDGTGLASIQT
jgi:hypothetical protein